jgi:hypothetical protein
MNTSAAGLRQIFAAQTKRTFAPLKPRFAFITPSLYDSLEKAEDLNSKMSSGLLSKTIT